jgi:hypothetical protein
MQGSLQQWTAMVVFHMAVMGLLAVVTGRGAMFVIYYLAVNSCSKMAYDCYPAVNCVRYNIIAFLLYLRINVQHYHPLAQDGRPEMQARD